MSALIDTSNLRQTQFELSTIIKTQSDVAAYFSAGIKVMTEDIDLREHRQFLVTQGSSSLISDESQLIATPMEYVSVDSQAHAHGAAREWSMISENRLSSVNPDYQGLAGKNAYIDIMTQQSDDMLYAGVDAINKIVQETIAFQAPKRSFSAARFNPAIHVEELLDVLRDEILVGINMPYLVPSTSVFMNPKFYREFSKSVTKTQTAIETGRLDEMLADGIGEGSTSVTDAIMRNVKIFAGGKGTFHIIQPVSSRKLNPTTQRPQGERRIEFNNVAGGDGTYTLLLGPNPYVDGKNLGRAGINIGLQVMKTKEEEIQRSMNKQVSSFYIIYSRYIADFFVSVKITSIDLTNEDPLTLT